jgi:hypothetical protein
VISKDAAKNVAATSKGVQNNPTLSGNLSCIAALVTAYTNSPAGNNPANNSLNSKDWGFT